MKKNKLLLLVPFLLFGSTSLSSCDFPGVIEKEIKVTGVSLDKTSGEINIGGTLTLTAAVTPNDAKNKNVSWSSSDESVATVANGVVTGHKAGDAVITVKTADGNYEAKCNIKVVENITNVTGVFLNKTSAELFVDGTLTLTATVTPSDASNKELVWTSSDESVATVANGVVTAKATGNTTITVKTVDGNFEKTCSVSVIEDNRTIYNIPNAYGTYYNSLTSWTDGEDLKLKLRNLMADGYVMNTYANPTNWTTNTKADAAIDNHSMVDVVYKADNEWAEANGSKTGGWQREHAFCASLMTGVMTGSAVQFIGRATDFHNLWASNQSGNGSRGNRNLGFVEDNELAPSPNDRINDCRRSTDGLNTFEPADYDKGKLSRSIFYIATLYGDGELDKTVNGSKTYSTGTGANKKTYSSADVYGQGVTLVEEPSAPYLYRHGNLSDLLEFNKKPVDRHEYQHMSYVYSEQHNRNVYVDYPELVDYVFGSKKDQAGELKYLKPSAIDLKLDEPGIANYAVDNVVHSFKVGDKFTSSSFNVVAVNNDYSETAVSVENYTCNLAWNYEFTSSDIGSKEIQVTVGDQVIKYNVTIENYDELANCSWHHTFAKADFNSAVADTPKDITVSGLGFSFLFTSRKDTPTIVSLSSGKGVQIGTGTKVADKVTLTSKSSLSNINKIYFAGDTASSCSMTVKFYIDDVQVGTTKTINYNSSGAVQCGVNLETPQSGVVKVEVTVGDKAVYIYALGINYGA